MLPKDVEKDIKLVKPLVVIALNPAWQTTLQFQQFKPGHVNRAARKCHSVGGKGQNVAIAVEQLGKPELTTVFQTTDLDTAGTHIKNVLLEKKIHSISIPISTPIRTCTTCLDLSTGSMTELIEPSGTLTQTEIKMIKDAYMEAFKSPNLKAIALCGSLPPGLNADIYKEMAINKPDNVILLLDTSKDVAPLTTGKVDILKINFEETCIILGIVLDHSLSESDWHRQYPPAEIGLALLQKFPQLKIFAMTCGAHSAYLFDNRLEKPIITSFTIPDLQEWIESEQVDVHEIVLASTPASSSLPRPTALDHIPSPSQTSRKKSITTDSRFEQKRTASSNSLANINHETVSSLLKGLSLTRRTVDGKSHVMLNPLGAGDTCAGVFLAELISKNATLQSLEDIEQSFASGLAAASASCFSIEHTAHFDISVQQALLEKIKTTRVEAIPWSNDFGFEKMEIDSHSNNSSLSASLKRPPK